VTDIQEPNPSPCLEMAHVLFMDIVAYSQLPMDEQTRLVGKLQQIVRGTAEFARAQKRHQLLRLPTGDGMALVFFGNAEAPVRCAISVQRAAPFFADAACATQPSPLQVLRRAVPSRRSSSSRPGGFGVHHGFRVLVESRLASLFWMGGNGRAG